ncbi:MAG: hypothetical protein HQ567_03040, partial [Candidatus Nealsonbacteria bacterium]|nr:hypothetical protein [Candidatus Nealsonbacteria bacterium]
LSDKYGLGITFPVPEPPPPPPEPELVHQWTFNGNSLDSVGDAHGALQGDVEIVDGQLNLNKDGASITGGDRMVTGALGQPLGAKTLVAWCSLNDLFNSAGGPLSVQEGGTFDAITFGERQNATWFAGSSNWHRSQDPPQGGEVETKIDEEIMLAIAYNEDNSIDIYRDGVLFNSYTKGTLVNYGPNAVALIGPRADTDGFHNGTVNESRIYNYALDADEIAALYTEGPSSEIITFEKELAHRWSFNDGTADDSAGEAHGALEGGAGIVDGRLSIDGVEGSRMLTGEIGDPIWEKTMVVWTSLNDPLVSTRGSAMTLQSNAAGDVFDAIVYGEAAPQKWMNGSNFWARTDQPQTYGTEETVGDPDEVMIAITYAADNSITVYREGELYGTYTKGALTAFGANALVQIGPRHANHADVFDGFVNEARIYSYALTAEEIAQIFQLGSEVVSGMEWDGGSGNWADGNWNGGQPPMIGVPAILDTADSVVTVTIAAADFLPAQSVAIGETNAVTVVVEGDATLSADGEITVGNSSILQVDGTLTAASASVAGMLSGNGTINVEPIEILGTVAPGGNGIGTLTVGNGEMGLAGSATYDAQVSLAAVNAVTADQIAVSSTGALQLGGTLTVTSLGDRTDADSWANPKPKVVNNTLGSIGDIPTGTGFEFDTVTPTPGTTAASHIGQGAFLQGVTYVKAPTNPPITTGVELDLFVALGGDADGDGKVWLSDWAALRANFGNTGTGKTWTEGNFDPWVDDKVWLSDWAALRANFGNA